MFRVLPKANPRLFSSQTFAKNLPSHFYWTADKINLLPQKPAGIILDFAGVTGDEFCIAPTIAFKDAFSARKITLSRDALSLFMGTEKRKNVILLLDLYKEEWKQIYGRYPNGEDQQAVYDDVNSKLMTLIPQYAQWIKYAPEILLFAKLLNIPCALTTGYNSEQFATVKNKFAPHFDAVVTSNQVVKGTREEMVDRAAEELGVNIDKCCFISDAPSDIISVKSLSKDIYSIGVTTTGTGMQFLSREEEKMCGRPAFNQRAYKASKELLAAGADNVIANLSGLPDMLYMFSLKLSGKPVIEESQNQSPYPQVYLTIGSGL